MLLHADQARVKSTQVQEDKGNVELEMITATILKAVEEGLFSTTINSSISKKNEELLVTMGYYVKFGNQYNEVYTTICWR
jgi:hypothetical protein